MNEAPTGNDRAGSRPHPVVGFARALATALDKVGSAQPVFMTAQEKEEALRLLYAEEQRLAAVRMRVMATAEDVAEAHAARDVGAWLAHQTCTETKPMHAEHRLARALEHRWTRIAEALA